MAEGEFAGPPFNVHHPSSLRIYVAFEFKNTFGPENIEYLFHTYLPKKYWTVRLS